MPSIRASSIGSSAADALRAAKIQIDRIDAWRGPVDGPSARLESAINAYYTPMTSRLLNVSLARLKQIDEPTIDVCASAYA